MLVKALLYFNKECYECGTETNFSHSVATANEDLRQHRCRECLMKALARETIWLKEYLKINMGGREEGKKLSRYKWYIELLDKKEF